MAGLIEARARAVDFLRKSGGGIGVEIVVNVVLPYVIYDQAKPGLGEVGALIASSAPPILWSLIEFARRRRVDFISLFVLAGIALSLLAMLGGGSVKFLQLRERMVTGVIGLAFVVSALIRRPLIYEFARASMKRNQSAELAEFEAQRENPGFRRVMTTLTVVWGLGLMIEASLAAVLVWNLTVKQYMIAGPVMGYGVAGCLTLWTWLYVKRAQRLGEARRAREAEAAGAAGVMVEPSQ
jgi:tryptophan-rich sensory protein